MVILVVGNFVLPAVAGLDVATGFGLLATNFSLLVASLATMISSYYFILFTFSFPKIHDGMNEFLKL